jgi:hypothetical protein
MRYSRDHGQPAEGRGSRPALIRIALALACLSTLAILHVPALSDAAPDLDTIQQLDVLGRWGGAIQGFDMDSEGVAIVVQGDRLLTVRVGTSQRLAELLWRSEPMPDQGRLNGVILANGVAYVGFGTSVKIVSVSLDAAPRIVGEFGFPGSLFRREGDRLYIANNQEAAAFDISIPAQPVEVARWPTGPSYDIEVENGRLFVLGENEISAYQQMPEGRYELERSFAFEPLRIARDMAVCNGHIFVMAQNEGVLVLAAPVDAEWAVARRVGEDLFSFGGDFLLQAEDDRLILAGERTIESDIRLAIFDIRDPSETQLAASIDLPDAALLSLKLHGKELSIASRSGLDRYIFNSAFVPTHTGAWRSQGDPVLLAKLGSQHLAVAGQTSGLWIYDLSGWSVGADHQGPRLEARLIPSSRIRAVESEGSMLYLQLAVDGVQIVDASDPRRPIPRGLYVGEVRRSDSAGSIAIRRNVLWLAWSDDRLESVDVSDPDNPHMIADYDPVIPVVDDLARRYITNILPMQDTALLATRGGGMVLGDLSMPPALPLLALNEDLYDVAEVRWNETAGLAFVADRNLGLLVIEPRRELHGLEPEAYFPSPGASKLWVEGGVAYLMSISMGENPILRAIDVSRPTALVELAQIGLPFMSADLLGLGGRVFVAGDRQGLYAIGQEAKVSRLFLPRLDQP